MTIPNTRSWSTLAHIFALNIYLPSRKVNTWNLDHQSTGLRKSKGKFSGRVEECWVDFFFWKRRPWHISKNRCTPQIINFKYVILIGFSIINHPFWGTTIFGNIHILCVSSMYLLTKNWMELAWIWVCPRIQDVGNNQCTPPPAHLFQEIPKPHARRTPHPMWISQCEERWKCWLWSCIFQSRWFSAILVGCPDESM